MLPPLVVNVLLGLIALLVVLLAVRVAVRWSKHRSGAAPEAAADADGPLVDFEPAAVEAASGAADFVARRDAAAAPGTTSPHACNLFGDRRGSNPLPHVRPDEMPSVDTADYVLGKTLTPALASLLPESEERRVEVRRELVNAGFYGPHAYENLAALRYVGLVLMLVLFGGLLVILPDQFEIAGLVGVVLGPILAWSLPRLWVRGRAADRLAEIERGVPDMLDMLNMCVGQGLTVQRSLARLSGDLAPAYPALARELAIVVEQSRIGTFEQALVNFERRVDVPEVHSFVALLVQTERMGTSVSAALVDHGDNMRESLRQRADNKANQATFKLLFPTVLCLMPAVYLFLLGPALIELTKFTNGGGFDAVQESSRLVREVQEQ